jgi:RHS repeat-associated protein
MSYHDGELSRAAPHQSSPKAPGTTVAFLYYGLRYYNPTDGRWPSRDPIGENGGINLYGYVGGDPINAVDPQGLWQITIGGAWAYGGVLSFGKNNGQWNGSVTVGYGYGFTAGINPNDNTVGHLQGPALSVGENFIGKIGREDLAVLGGSVSVSMEQSVFEDPCKNDYWFGTTAQGEVGNMYLGGVSGSAWAGVTGNALNGTIASSIESEPEGWNYSVNAIGLAGYKIGYHD